jgi:hypothetical protein
MFIARPAYAADEIARDKSALLAGFIWVTFFCICYSVTVLIAYILGGKPGGGLLLPIPPESWYLVQTFTTLPAGLTGMFAYAGASYILARAFGSGAAYDSVFGAMAFCLHIPCFIFMWVPETFLFPFLLIAGAEIPPWPFTVELFRVFIIPFLWIFSVSTISLVRITKLRWWKCLVISVVSCVPAGMIMAVFIR